MIKNLLRGIRTYKKDAAYAGGLSRARSMLSKNLLQRLQPTTNPVQAETQMPEEDPEVRENGSIPSIPEPPMILRPTSRPRPTRTSETTETVVTPLGEKEEGMEMIYILILMISMLT